MRAAIVRWLDARQKRIATAYADKHRAPIGPTGSFTTKRSLR